MPTYILSKIERTGSGQKVADLTAVEKPPTELTALAEDDQIPVTDTGSSGAWKYLKPSVLLTWLDSRIAATWGKITGKPSTFPPSAHSHAYADITSKPTTFAPSAHNQAASTISGLGALATRNSVGQSQIDADSVGSSEVKNSEASGIRTAIGLGTAATKDAANPLEAVNSNPVHPNGASDWTDGRLYATGITIPNSSQLLAIEYFTTNRGGSNAYPWFASFYIFNPRHLLTRPALSAGTHPGVSTFTDIENLQFGTFKVGTLQLERTSSNELLVSHTGNFSNRKARSLTLYKVRQAVG